MDGLPVPTSPRRHSESLGERIHAAGPSEVIRLVFDALADDRTERSQIGEAVVQLAHLAGEVHRVDEQPCDAHPDHIVRITSVRLGTSPLTGRPES
jgi:hypothetical protein